MKNAMARRSPPDKDLVRFQLIKTIAVAGAILLASPVQAQDLRYCLAVDATDSMTFFSEIFADHANLDAIERAFGRALAGRGQPHLRPSCPRAPDSESAQRDRFRAIEYNRSLGRQAIIMDWRYQ